MTKHLKLCVLSHHRAHLKIQPIKNKLQTLCDDPLQPFLDSFIAVQTNQRVSGWDKNGAVAPRSACASWFAVPVLQKWGAEFTLPGWGAGGYLNVACTSRWRQHGTDLILRLVPVFQIPVPQDHLKHKEQTSNVSWTQPLLYIYTRRNTFSMKVARILLLQRFWVFTEGIAGSGTGCQPLVHAVIWIHTVATVYFEDFLDCVMHGRLQVCIPPRQWQTVACDWQGKEEKKTTKTAAACQQWGCEILSGNSYVNRPHFRGFCW